jgi:S-adenosylmethionine decarboxylase
LPQPYTPGLHLLLRLQCARINYLCNMEQWLIFARKALAMHGMEVVGEVTHIFEGGGFTVAICLKESHLCIHTWPECGCLTMDIYLCNYRKDNSDTVRALAAAHIAYFEAAIVQQNEVYR